MAETTFDVFREPSMRHTHLPFRRACTLGMLAAACTLWLLLGAAPASAQTTVGGATTVVVAPGDTLISIALEHSTTVSALVRSNGLDSADLIFVGQELVVPGATTSPGVSSSPEGGSHVVLPGETLYGIASRYQTSVTELARVNDLWSPDYIYVGQKLVIPGSTSYPSTGLVGGTIGRSILVDLSSQQLHALENGNVVRSFTVSTGKPSTPTPTGSFAIYSRYPMQRMVGVDYDLPNVTYVQYFEGPYSFHGTYWHSDFGTPVSHGCINLQPADAEWLWSWTGIGTPVVVRW